VFNKLVVTLMPLAPKAIVKLAQKIKVAKAKAELDDVSAIQETDKKIEDSGFVAASSLEHRRDTSPDEGSIPKE